MSSDELHASDQVEVAWADEISRRAQEVTNGVVESVDGDAALERVQQRLQERRTHAANRE